jgi:hypothetical protein
MESKYHKILTAIGFQLNGWSYIFHDKDRNTFLYRADDSRPYLMKASGHDNNHKRIYSSVDSMELLFMETFGPQVFLEKDDEHRGMASTLDTGLF